MNPENFEAAKMAAMPYINQVENEILRKGFIGIFAVSKSNVITHAEGLQTACRYSNITPDEFLREWNNDKTAQAFFLKALNASHGMTGAAIIKPGPELDTLVKGIVKVTKSLSEENLAKSLGNSLTAFVELFPTEILIKLRKFLKNRRKIRDLKTPPQSSLPPLTD